MSNAAGDRELLPCDTVVFTGDWIPDHELARHGRLAIDPGTNGPEVDASLHTSVPGVFAAGNLIHPVETADVVALEADRLAALVARFLEDGAAAPPTVPLRVEPPLTWIAPNRVGSSSAAPLLGRFTFLTARRSSCATPSPSRRRRSGRSPGR